MNTADHYLRSCGNATCSRPQQKASRLRIEPRTPGTGVNHSTPAPVQSTPQYKLLEKKGEERKIVREKERRKKNIY